MEAMNAGVPNASADPVADDVCVGTDPFHLNEAARSPRTPPPQSHRAISGTKTLCGRRDANSIKPVVACV